MLSEPAINSGSNAPPGSSARAVTCSDPLAGRAGPGRGVPTVSREDGAARRNLSRRSTKPSLGLGLLQVWTWIRTRAPGPHRGGLRGQEQGAGWFEDSPLGFTGCAEAPWAGSTFPSDEKTGLPEDKWPPRWPSSGDPDIKAPRVLDPLVASIAVLPLATGLEPARHPGWPTRGSSPTYSTCCSGGGGSPGVLQEVRGPVRPVARPGKASSL